MDINKDLICSKCNGKCFKIKREATYVYTYEINTPEIENNSENKESLPFLFDNREKIRSKEYIQCDKCGEVYPCPFDINKEKIDLIILQKALRSDYKKEPEFLG